LAGLGYNGRGVAMTNVMGRALAAHALGATDESPFPISRIRPYPLYRLRRPGVNLALWWMRRRDALEAVSAQA
jgi:sarcosine oxidase